MALRDADTAVAPSGAAASSPRPGHGVGKELPFVMLEREYTELGGSLRTCSVSLPGFVPPPRGLCWPKAHWAVLSEVAGGARMVHECNLASACLSIDNTWWTGAALWGAVSRSGQHFSGYMFTGDAPMTL